MARIKKYKIARRLGAGVYDKTQSQKFMLSEQKRFKSSTRRPKRPSDYGLSLIQKQRVRFAYGVSEKQFSNYVKKAFAGAKRGFVPADALFRSVEKRLDNTMYRAGFAGTRATARQLVSHGHFVVNGKKTTIPSYQVKKGDVITLREGSVAKIVFADLEERLTKTKQPDWLSVDAKKKQVEVVADPKNPEPFFNFQAVIEFYSR